MKNFLEIEDVISERVKVYDIQKSIKSEHYWKNYYNLIKKQYYKNS